MALLIDGYNLLYASGILGHGRGRSELESSRRALLDFLAESLDARELAETTVVFDAREAPPNLPRRVDYRGIKICFSERQSDADELIEELIRAHSAPRRLIVVSSDHRLHRAAKRRNAKPIDSDRWYFETLRKRIAAARGQTSPEPPGAAKVSEAPSESEVRYWLRQFGLEDPAADAPPPSAAAGSPFPPGYGEDVTAED